MLVPVEDCLGALLAPPLPSLVNLGADQLALFSPDEGFVGSLGCDFFLKRFW
jgi:hypothetical protein